MLGGFVVLLIIGSLASQSPQSKKESEMVAAIAECDEQVRARLKAPATAKFPALPEVQDKGGGVAVVISYVDAQNSFGAQIRTRWICEVNVSAPQRPNVNKVVLEQ